MKHIGLFEGIGGFSLAARWMGWQTVAWCEWNPFCQKVLSYHFPEAEQFTDITKSDFTKYHGTVDIITGGFPCQPYSVAGKQKGKEDERHLWPEMLRVIRQVAPTWVIGENVPGLVSWSDGMVFDEVQHDLETCGYEVVPFIIPAAGVGAPHKRDRVWFVAYAHNHGPDGTQNGQGHREGNDHNKTWQNAVEQFEGCSNKATAEYRPTENAMQDGWGGEQLPANNAETGAVADTQRIGHVQCEQQEQPRCEERIFEGLCNNGLNTHPTNTGLETATNTLCKGLQGSEWGISEGIGLTEPSTIAATDTNSDQRCERGMRQEGCEEAERYTSAFDTRQPWRAWENFPTQSPVCNGDDGLSARLDAITFPKWRAESIKAGGNAIVSQVALQIFKAIVAFEEQLKQEKAA